MKKYLLLFFLGILSINAITQAQTNTLIPAEQILEAANKNIANIDTNELLELLDMYPNMVLIDVRTEREISIVGTILRGQNINIPRGWLEFRISQYAKDKNTPIVVYCGTNQRSPLAAKTLQDMGYSNVKNYAAGYFAWQAADNPVQISDYERQSFLYRKPIKVAKNVYSAIGAAQPPSYENSNHNNNLSFIVTTDGVLVFNAGGNYLLAKALHEEIKKVTNQPVKVVVLENAQGHAILGSNYWQEQGTTIIAHKLAKEEIVKHQDEIFERAKNRIGDKISGTKIVLPDEVFKDKKILQMGDTKIELLYLGASHSPDDIQLWLPQQKILISGDTAFNERLLPVFVHTNISDWIETWDRVEALKPRLIIPGHGHPTDLATVTKFTKDYLVYMRAQVEKILDEDGSLDDAYNIDQSQFRDWGTYGELHRQNVGRIFRQMEFE